MLKAMYAMLTAEKKRWNQSSYPKLTSVITILLRYSLKENTINFKANHMRATFVFLWGWSDNTRSNMQFSCLKSQITQRFCKGSPEENCAALINSVSLWENRESFMTQILLWRRWLILNPLGNWWVHLRKIDCRVTRGSVTGLNHCTCPVCVCACPCVCRWLGMRGCGGGTHVMGGEGEGVVGGCGCGCVCRRWRGRSRKPIIPISGRQNWNLTETFGSHPRRCDGQESVGQRGKESVCVCVWRGGGLKRNAREILSVSPLAT